MIYLEGFHSNQKLGNVKQKVYSLVILTYERLVNYESLAALVKWLTMPHLIAEIGVRLALAPWST